MSKFKRWWRAVNPARQAARLADAELLERLGGLNENHPAWEALCEIVGRQAELEEAAALAPNLSSESLHRNTGRLSALRDLQAALAELWARTHPQ